MDVSPYLRKPLRSLQEVEGALKPQAGPQDEAAAPSEAGGAPDSGPATSKPEL